MCVIFPPSQPAHYSFSFKFQNWKPSHSPSRPMQTLPLAIGKRGRGEDTDHESLREVRILENQAGARMFSPFQSPSPSPSIGWGISHALRNAVCRYEWSLSTCATPRGSSPRWLALLRAAPGPTSGTGRCLYKVRLAIFRHHICVC
jgi:hypothetical protein